VFGNCDIRTPGRTLLFLTGVVGIIFMLPRSTEASEWNSADVGAVGIAGSAVENSSGVWTLQGDGADIWGSADAFHYLYRSETSVGFRLTTRVDDLQNTDQFAKIGVMFRTSLNPDAATILLDAKPSGEVEFMNRSSDEADMQYVGGVFLNFPMWLRLDCFSGSGTVADHMDCVPWVSQDGVNWNFNFAPSRILPVPSTGYLAGLAVTSHNPGALTTAHAGALRLLAGYTDDDIGSTGAASNAAMDVAPPSAFNQQFTIEGAGADIWGPTDSFAFVHQSSGIGSLNLALRYRVISVEDTNPFAKAGLMFRDGLSPDSLEVVADMKPNGELEFMARTCAGCSVNYLGGAFVSFPAYIALTRNGSTFTAQVGSDPSSMQQVGLVNVPMANPFPGFAVTSHDTAQLTTAVIDGPWVP